MANGVTSGNNVHVTLPDVDSGASAYVLDYLYTGRLQVDAHPIYDSITELRELYALSLRLRLDKLGSLLLNQLEGRQDLAAKTCSFFRSARLVYEDSHTTKEFRDTFRRLAFACIQAIPYADRPKFTKIAGIEVRLL